MVFGDPLLDVMLQTLRNPDHLFHFAMRNSSADVVTAHVSPMNLESFLTVSSSEWQGSVWS